MQAYDALRHLCETIAATDIPSARKFIKTYTEKDSNFIWCGVSFKIVQKNPQSGHPAFTLECTNDGQIMADLFVMYPDSESYYWEM